MANEAYTTLGVSCDAAQDEIKSAYRKLAKQYHPDLHPGDEACAAKMNEINAAYEQISDPEKRKLYDASQISPYGSYENPFGAQNGQDPFSAWFSSAFSQYDQSQQYGQSQQYRQTANWQYNQTSDRDQDRQPHYRFYSYPFGTGRRPRSFIGRLIRAFVICWLISFLFRLFFGVGFYFLWL